MPEITAHQIDYSISSDAVISERDFDCRERKRRCWVPSMENMPPVAQFVLRCVAWCRGKYRDGKNKEAPLRMVGQLALGGKRHLALVQVGDLQFLVGGGVDQINVIMPVQAANGTAATETNDLQRIVERGDAQ